MERRKFLGTVASLGAAAWASSAHGAVENNPKLTDEQIKASLIDVAESAPMLQRPEKDAMATVWSVKRPATGWVEWGPTPELGETARDSVGGLFPYEERFLAATMRGLEAGKTYYYRTVTQGLEFKRYGQLFAGEPERSEIFSFQTADDSSSAGSFAVISDTHENYPCMDALTDRIDTLNPDCVVWNGDLLNDANSADQAVHGILQAGKPNWLASRPVLFTAGNHDHRGPWARNMTKIFLPRNKFDAKYSSLIYNYAYRTGPLALIGLDTGEDKPDFHPIWTGLADFDRQRVLQAQWLEETLLKPEIASAAFVVVCCHIPLFDPRPDANPGEILDGFASWQSRCAELWGPILNRHKVQAVITGHLHRPNGADQPSAERSWLQMHGGGPEKKHWCVVHGQAKNNKLTLRRERLPEGTVDEEWSFEPRDIE